MKLQFLAIAILAAPVAAAAGRGATPLPRMRSIAPRALKLRGGATVTPASEGLIAHIVSQVSYEIANCNTSPAKKFGFCGACCNWFLGFSAVYDASHNGPQLISLPMTFAMLLYSLLFGRWAGWDVSPKNYVLAGSHLFNICAQLNQLRRALEYKLQTQGEAAKAEISALGVKAASGLTVAALFTLAAPSLQDAMPEGSWLASSGGPFTIHPWPPVTKLFLSAASLTDLHRPTDKISLMQYAALTVTGAIFSQYGLLVTPINYPLTAVNVLLFASSAWHLGRKIKADFL